MLLATQQSPSCSMTVYPLSFLHYVPISLVERIYPRWTASESSQSPSYYLSSTYPLPNPYDSRPVSSVTTTFIQFATPLSEA